jgi:CubicO group peptidase (beta-lactamase class C family)
MHDHPPTMEATMEGSRLAKRVGGVLLGAVVCGAAPEPAGAQAMMGGEWRDDVRAYAQRIVDHGLAPGLGVAVAVGDWVVFEDGFGAADIATGRPVAATTPFYIASTTKSLTALAAVLMAGRNELDLDRSIDHYLPELRLPDGVEPGTIRVRDLLTLTHGLSGAGPIVVRTAYTGQYTNRDLLRLLAHHAQVREPGTFQYDNLGFNLLGMVLEEAAGAGWKEVVEREVLQPLGMSRTSAHLSRLDPATLALPHEMRPDRGFGRVELAKTDATMHAAGGHFASAGDLARYLAAHLSGGRVDGVEALPGAPVLSTHEPHATQDREFGPYLRHAWGYGWDIGTYNGELLIHRFGSFPGYRSHASFMPERGVGVAVLTNGGGLASPAVDLLANFIYDRLANGEGVGDEYDARLRALEEQAGQARRALAAELEGRAGRLGALRHPLDHFAGLYENDILGHIEFRVVAGGLEYRMGAARGRAEVYDANEDMLRVVIGSGMVAAFDFPSAGGPATSVRLSGVPLPMTRRSPD